MREVVQRASVSQWFVQTGTGLHIATKEVAVKLLLARGQIHRRHGVASPAKPSGWVEKCDAIINSQEISGVDAGGNPQEYNVGEPQPFKRQQQLEVKQALARYLFYADGHRWPEVCPARIDRRDSRLMRVYPLGRPRTGPVPLFCEHVSYVPHAAHAVGGDEHVTLVWQRHAANSCRR